MAFVPDKPVRIREYLADGTAHDATVGLVPEDDSIEVLDENGLDGNEAYLPPVYYDKKQTAELKQARDSKAKKSPANKEEAPK